MSKGTGPGMVLVKVEMARNAAGWKGTIVGWPETRKKKRRRQATPRCGRHVRLYEPPPPSVPFGFLPSSARRFPSRRGCNGGRGGNLKMGSLLAGCAYRQSFSSPPPRGHPSNSQGRQCGDHSGQTITLAPSPGPNHGDFPHTPPRLALFGRIQSASTTGLPHLIRHVRGHCAPFQQFVRDSTTWPRGRTQHDQQAELPPSRQP